MQPETKAGTPEEISSWEQFERRLAEQETSKPTARKESPAAEEEKGPAPTGQQKEKPQGPAAKWYEFRISSVSLKSQFQERKQEEKYLLEDIFRRMYDTGRVYDYVIALKQSAKTPEILTVRYFLRTDEDEAPAMRMLSRSYGMDLVPAEPPDVGPAVAELEFDHPTMLYGIIPRGTTAYSKTSELITRTIQSDGGGIWIRLMNDSRVGRGIVAETRPKKTIADHIFEFIAPVKDDEAKKSKILEEETKRRKATVDERLADGAIPACRIWAFGSETQVRALLNNIPRGANAVRLFKWTSSSPTVDEEPPSVPARARLKRSILSAALFLAPIAMVISGMLNVFATVTWAVFGLFWAFAIIARLGWKIRNPIALSVRELATVFSPPPEPERFSLEFTEFPLEEKVLPDEDERFVKGVGEVEHAN